jgi:hypothetical protein
MGKSKEVYYTNKPLYIILVELLARDVVPTVKERLCGQY